MLGVTGVTEVNDALRAPAPAILSAHPLAFCVSVTLASSIAGAPSPFGQALLRYNRDAEVMDRRGRGPSRQDDGRRGLWSSRKNPRGKNANTKACMTR